MEKLKIAHIVPAMNIGGVEVAIQRTASKLRLKFDYQVYFVKSAGPLKVGQTNILNYIKLLLVKSKRPDVVITSLWWSHVFGLFAKLLGVKWVVFLHSSHFASLPDRIITSLATRLASYFWYDSKKTCDALLQASSKRQFHIPFLTFDTEEDVEVISNTDFDIIWVGRNSDEKRLDLVETIVSQLLATRPDSKICLCVAGDEYEPFEKLENSFPKNVNLRYNLMADEMLTYFRQSSIALCVSDYEGFSMSTAEAALSGNLIAARPVGELETYLPRQDTIWLNSIDDVSINDFVKQIRDNLSQPDLLLQKRIKSLNSTLLLIGQKTYLTAFSDSIQEISRDS